MGLRRAQSSGKEIKSAPEFFNENTDVIQVEYVE